MQTFALQTQRFPPHMESCAQSSSKLQSAKHAVSAATQAPPLVCAAPTHWSHFAWFVLARGAVANATTPIVAGSLHHLLRVAKEAGKQGIVETLRPVEAPLKQAATHDASMQLLVQSTTIPHETVRPRC